MSRVFSSNTLASLLQRLGLLLNLCKIRLESWKHLTCNNSTEHNSCKNLEEILVVSFTVRNVRCRFWFVEDWFVLLAHLRIRNIPTTYLTGACRHYLMICWNSFQTGGSNKFVLSPQSGKTNSAGQERTGSYYSRDLSIGFLTRKDWKILHCTYIHEERTRNTSLPDEKYVSSYLMYNKNITFSPNINLSLLPLPVYSLLLSGLSRLKNHVVGKQIKMFCYFSMQGKRERK